MADQRRSDKYFQYSHADDLKHDLVGDKKSGNKNVSRKKTAMKRIIANATMGNDMSPLFEHVAECMEIPDLELKKLVYLYLTNYGLIKRGLLSSCIPRFLADAANVDPQIRTLALKTMASLLTPEMASALLDPLRTSLFHKAPAIRMTAALCVAKLFRYDAALVEKNGFFDNVQAMLMDNHASVVGNAAMALYEMVEHSSDIRLTLHYKVAHSLVGAMEASSEWGHAYELELLLFFVPQTTQEAALLAEGVAARLRPGSPSVVLATTKVVMYLLNYMDGAERKEAMYRRISQWLVPLLSEPPEMQFIVLRNLLLLVQRRPLLLRNDIHAFFCQYDDPLYVKTAKLDMIYRLTHEENVMDVLQELQDYAAEIDIEFARKAIHVIGRLALVFDSVCDACVAALEEIIENRVNYAVQEAIIVMKDILRKHPNRYENVIATLCGSLDVLDEPRAKMAMVWILGHYAHRISGSEKMLGQFVEHFLEEPVETQLVLLTATVKLFLHKPSAGSELLQRVLTWTTEQVMDPDCRDRGYFYSRLLAADVAAARKVVLHTELYVEGGMDRMDLQLLNQLLLQAGTLAAVFHRPPQTFVLGARARYMPDSPVLEEGARRYASVHLHVAPPLRWHRRGATEGAPHSPPFLPVASTPPMPQEKRAAAPRGSSTQHANTDPSTPPSSHVVVGTLI